MRRIYESDALVRDDDDPHVPTGDDGDRSRSAIDWRNLSHALLPSALRDRAIDVSVETDRDVYAVGEPVGMRIRFRNRLPFPVVLRTASPERWTWGVDGLPQASEVAAFDPPDRRSTVTFDRSERRTYERTWPQKIRTGEDTWEAVAPGEYTVAAWVNVDDPAERGLHAERTVEIR